MKFLSNVVVSRYCRGETGFAVGYMSIAFWSFGDSTDGGRPTASMTCFRRWSWPGICCIL